MKNIGIIGASGYTGAELLRIIAGHPELNLKIATGETQAGTAIRDLYPKPFHLIPAGILRLVFSRNC